MKKPNFFIVGAPKCGTTSWAVWLSQHPEVYFSHFKEPHFFNFDEPKYHFVSSLKDYESLFSSANDSHKAVGEGSVWYLHSKVAIQNILSYAPSSKIIICIRNPVQMAHALHAEMTITGEEHVHVFDKAWLLQTQRMKNTAVTKWATEPSHLVYGEVCKIGQQVKRAVETIKQEHLHIIVLDDTKRSPQEEFCKVIDFLGISKHKLNDFSPKNTSKSLRSPILMKLMRMVGSIKNKYRIKTGLGLANLIISFSRSGPPRKPLSEEMTSELKRYFKSDVYLLSNIIDRDFMHWVE